MKRTMPAAASPIRIEQSPIRTVPSNAKRSHEKGSTPLCPPNPQKQTAATAPVIPVNDVAIGFNSPSHSEVEEFYQHDNAVKETPPEDQHPRDYEYEYDTMHMQDWDEPEGDIQRAWEDSQQEHREIQEAKEIALALENEQRGESNIYSSIRTVL